MTWGHRAGVATYGPWFQTRPRSMVAVCIALFGAVGVLQVPIGSGAGPGVTPLFALPISLLALAGGRIVGVLAGSAGVALLAGSAGLGRVDASSVACAALAVAFVMVGYLLGDASERLGRAEDARIRAEAQALKHREAVEINDRLVQGMAAAKWSLEAGQVGRSLEVLEGTIDEGQRLVSELIRENETEPANTADGQR